MKQGITITVTSATRGATPRARQWAIRSVTTALRRAWRMAVASAAMGVVAAAIAGCGGPSVGDVCAKWDSRDCPAWTGKSECVAAGKSLEESASATGCDVEFQEYLQCVQELNNCDWGHYCTDEKTTLVNCTGAGF